MVERAWRADKVLLQLGPCGNPTLIRGPPRSEADSSKQCSRYSYRIDNYCISKAWVCGFT